MWGKRIQEAISERPDEEDCESYDRKNTSYDRSQKKSLNRIEKILDSQANETNDLNFLKKKR